MRAAQVVRLDGPLAVEINEIEEPTEVGVFGPQILVEVHAVGVSFPDLLMSKGEYQLKPALPFTLGVDFAGVVRSAPEGTGFAAGDRVACVGANGGATELVGLGKDTVFPLPGSFTFAQGAALPMNYLTAQFVLKERGQLLPGETVLVNGAAGGVGTATIQVAKGYGARVIAVVSNQEKADFARAAGADEVVLVDGFLAAVKELTGGAGVDLVVDVVGGDMFKDSLRSLATQGRLLVVGFAGGSIPEVKINRLLLNNTDVRGAAWGEYAMTRPGYMTAQWRELEPMMASGVIDPPIGATYRLEEFGRALQEMDDRRTLGKSVLTVR
ncbi:NADPH2:quinone reductase [Marmoricola sp. OAE513]|uniref:NADPH:quinone oxidoreductase family protein n=1 Tax=Marmoricola sp. OAE513 TaxID=2817894 RepID=UPI001AE29CB1